MAKAENDRPSPTCRTSETYRAVAKAMLDHAEDEAFSLETGTHEHAIYEDLFRSSAIHRKSASDEWELAPPTRSDWRTAWTAMIDGFDRATETRVSLTELASLMSRQASAADVGMIRLLLIAGLLTRREDLVLYENHNLVAAFDSMVAARISEDLDDFSVKNVQTCDGQRNALLDILTRRLQLQPRAGNSRLLEVTVALYRTFQALPPYAQQTTRSLSRDTLAIRQCIRGASEPDVLIFEALPIVLMIEPFSGPTPLSHVSAGEYTTGIFKAIRELQAAYPALLADIRQALAQAVLSDATSLSELRKDMTAKAQTLATRDLRPELDGFVRALISSGSDEEWLQVVASTAAGGASPKGWTDDTITGFRTHIQHLGGMLCRELASS